MGIVIVATPINVGNLTVLQNNEVKKSGSLSIVVLWKLSRMEGGSRK